MSYIQDSLMQDEVVIFETKSHKVLLFISILSLVIGIILLIIFLNWDNLSGYGIPDSVMAYKKNQLHSLIIAVFFMIFGVHRYILYKTSEFALTNKRVIAKFGFIKQVSIDLNIDKVQGIVVDQTIWGRIFNYGTVKVVGVGVNEQIPFIPEPLKFRKLIQEHMNK